jgi:hypothetical protein
MTTTFFNLPEEPDTVDQLDMNMRVAKNRIMELNTCNNEQNGPNDHFLTVLLEIDGLYLNDLQKAYCKTWVAYIFIRNCKGYAIKCYSYMDVKYLVEAFFTNAVTSNPMWTPEDPQYFQPELRFGKEPTIQWLLGYLKEPYDNVNDAVVVSTEDDNHTWNIREAVLNFQRILQIKTIYTACDTEVKIIRDYYASHHRERIPYALFKQEIERTMATPPTPTKRFNAFGNSSAAAYPDPKKARTVTQPLTTAVLPTIPKQPNAVIKYRNEIIKEKEYPEFYRQYRLIEEKIAIFKRYKQT